MDIQSPIKTIRERVDISQRELAKVIEENISVISRLEMGEISVDNNIDVIEKISELVDVDSGIIIEKQKTFQKAKEEEERRRIKKKLKETDFSDLEK